MFFTFVKTPTPCTIKKIASAGCAKVKIRHIELFETLLRSRGFSKYTKKVQKKRGKI